MVFRSFGACRSMESNTRELCGQIKRRQNLKGDQTGGQWVLYSEIERDEVAPDG